MLYRLSTDKNRLLPQSSVPRFYSAAGSTFPGGRVEKYVRKHACCPRGRITCATGIGMVTARRATTTPATYCSVSIYLSRMCGCYVYIPFQQCINTTCVHLWTVISGEPRGAASLAAFASHLARRRMRGAVQRASWRALKRFVGWGFPYQHRLSGSEILVIVCIRRARAGGGGPRM